MHFAFTPEQEQFRDAVRRFLRDRSPPTEARRLMEDERGHDPAIWRQLCQELGLGALHVPEERGGQGFTVTELGIAFEEMGRALLCAPYLSSVLATTAVAEACAREEAEQIVTGIASGEQLAALALTEANGRWDLGGIELVANGNRLTGSKTHVIDGHVADLLIVAARTAGSTGEEGLSLHVVAADAPGITRRSLTALDPTRKLARIDFANVEARCIANDAAPALRRTLDMACIAVACELAGVAEALLESAVDYAKLRMQFGRAVGSFQAIKHKCADLLLEVELAKSAARYAAEAATEGDSDLPALASLAKAAASDAAMRAARDCIQIHGGIGFTWDNDTHLWFKRAKSSEALFGAPAWHWERLMQCWEPSAGAARRAVDAEGAAPHPADGEA